MPPVSVELDATLAAPAAEALATAATAAPVSGPAPDATATATSPGRPGERAAPALGPGVRLAHFEIVRPLGAGGMGEVYLATDLALDRPVALKVLPAAVARDRGRRDRMVREARAQARLNHPHVAHIYYIGEDLGHLFFAMEYVDGETLAQRLERGPVPPEEALELARMAALGLREAHRHGFTHRDVKPSNLMIDRHGVVKVMDFGLVTDALTVAAASDGDDDSTAVAASALVGTPLYMAPEQGQGRAVDHRADIYALGATLHHLIAGAPPFAGGSAAELLSLHESGARVPLPAGRGHRIAGLADAVIARMMAKRLADRPTTYDQVIAELDAANPTRSRPAGFVVRTVASTVDLLLCAVLGVPIGMINAGDGNLSIPIMFLLVLPLLISRLGTTLGKALFDLAVVGHHGAPVGFGRAAVRYLVMVGPLAAAVTLETVAGLADLTVLERTAEVLVGLGFLYPLLELARVSLTTADARPLWDRVARTRIGYRVRGRAAAGERAGAGGDLPSRPSARGA